MTLSELAVRISEYEGGLRQVSIGNIREVLGVLSDLRYQDPSVDDALFKNGRRRHQKKTAKVKGREEEKPSLEPLNKTVVSQE